MIKLRTISDRTFGVELEMMLSTGTAMRTLHEAGLPMEGAGRWVVKTDGSVPGGCEVVSPVLRGRAGLQEVTKAVLALKRAGATINKNCGFHVHHGASDLSGADLKNLVKRYAKAEKAIGELVAPSRRANRYCAPIAGPNGDLIDLFRRLDAVQNRIPTVTRIANPNGRFVTLNLNALIRHNTVEFRQHQGTVNARKVVAWIIFTQCMVEIAKRDTTEARILSPRHVKMDTLLTMKGILAGHREFYTNRAAFMAEQEQARRDRAEARMQAREERRLERARQRAQDSAGAQDSGTDAAGEA